MADDDVRIARWDMRATAGMTVSRPFTATTAVTTVAVYTGGTVTNVDDLTGATAHEATVDGDGLGGTITVDVPTVSSVPLRLVVDGAVVTVGRLTPSTTGAATRDDTVTIAVAESSTLTLDLPSIVVNEGTGGGGGVHPDLASHDALGLATQVELEAEQTARTTGDADTLAAAVQRANHTGTQTSSTISDFTEAVQDAVAALLGAGSNITLTYDDASDSLTIDATGGGTSYTDEEVRDAIGVALVGAGLISVTPNDALDTITITTTATANSTDAALRDRTTHTGTQSIATVTGLQAALDAKETPAGAQAKADAALTAANTYTDNATYVPKPTELWISAADMTVTNGTDTRLKNTVGGSYTDGVHGGAVVCPDAAITIAEIDVVVSGAMTGWETYDLHSWWISLADTASLNAALFRRYGTTPPDVGDVLATSDTVNNLAMSGFTTKWQIKEDRWAAGVPVSDLPRRIGFGRGGASGGDTLAASMALLGFWIRQAS